MRKTIDFNSSWYFQRQNNGPAFALAQGDAVMLPHTWNAKDGHPNWALRKKPGLNSKVPL